MRISQILSRSLVILFLLSLCSLTNAVRAQTDSTEAVPQQTPVTTVIAPRERSAPPVVGRTDLYCAGFIQYAPAQLRPEIVGGEQEQEQRVYSEGDFVFLNAGLDQGVRVGQEFAIVRPRGAMTSKFTAKKGWLGVYMQELGRLRVTHVKDRVSVAQVTNSCDNILIGDLLQQVNNRVAPTGRTELELDRFSDPTGKQKGRIVMAREAREMVTRNHIVYIDLGAEDNVKAGDYLTIYRPAGTGNLTLAENEEIARAESSGFGSERYSGGKFSSQSQRTKDYTNTPGVFFKPEPATTREIRSDRPPVPRKVVGEMVILHVQTRTATAIITRTVQEVHTGDFVELQ